MILTTVLLLLVRSPFANAFFSAPPLVESNYFNRISSINTPPSSTTGLGSSNTYLDDNKSNSLSKHSNARRNPDENPRLVGLSFMLDDGTRKSHSLAENTAFVSGFFRGLSTKEAYRKLVTSLYFVYIAMEEAFDVIALDENFNCVSALDDKELRRVPSLEKDMEFFYGDNWKNKIKPSPATVTYVSRIREVAKVSPHLLVGHQYSRYLGDLFGGQMMGNMATRSLNLENGMGTEFYIFKDIPNAREFINDWYFRLNELPLTNEEKKEIVDEANLVFALNIGIFEELEGSSAKALWMLVMNTLKQKIGTGV